MKDIDEMWSGVTKEPLSENENPPYPNITNDVVKLGYE